MFKMNKIIKLNMEEKKDLGAFYTPKKTVEYMVKKLGRISTTAKILEPCGGDGIFVKELIKQGVKPSQITVWDINCLLYTSPSPRDLSTSRMPSSA